MKRTIGLVLALALTVTLAACGGGATKTSPPPAPTITAVSAGADHALARDANGRVWAWGDDQHGELGNGTTTTTAVSPFKVHGLSNVVAVAGGNGFSLALESDGTVWAWGYNGYGQLGDGTINPRSTPARVESPSGTGHLSNIVAIAAGQNHALALRNDGTVWAWGYNGYGQLGDASGSDQHRPVEVHGVAGGTLTGIAAIAAEANDSVALSTSGNLYAWGNDYDGQLGNGCTVPCADSTTPATVASVGSSGSVTAVAAGSNHMLALTSSGDVYAWGADDYGQLGNGTTSATGTSTPIQIASLANMIAIAAGHGDSFALGSDGALRAWGYNFSGQLGDGTTHDRHAPEVISGLAHVTAIAPGGAFTLALKRSGNVWGWGNNLFGQLAINTSTIQSASPIKVRIAP